MKRCSICLVIKEMRPKATENQTKYHYAPFAMATINNTDNPTCWRKCGKTGALSAGKNVIVFQPLRYTPTS